MSTPIAGKMEPFRPPRRWAISQGRLRATLGDGAVAFLCDFARGLPEPLRLVYRLIDDETRAGSYRLEPVSTAAAAEMLTEFADFIEQDARHDFGIFAASTGWGVDYDQHQNLEFFGPADEFLAHLEAAGFQAGDLTLPFPHAHHFHPEFDAELARLLAAYPWEFEPAAADE